jgi:YD repeat-containing protein
MNGETETFVFDEPALAAAGGNPGQLTGRIDSLGVRVAKFGYESPGFVNFSAGATIRGQDTNSFRLTSSVDASGRFKRVLVSTPTLATYEEHYVQDPAAGDRRRELSSGTQPAGSGCDLASSSQTYDSFGNLASTVNVNGSKTCYNSSSPRNLETVRVEGLTSGAACSVVGPGSSLPSGSRKVSTQWHPDWSLRSRLAEPGRLTTFVYNGQPNPFSAGAIETCAPATAVLPDGKPIAVLCRKIEQATTDAAGALGFSAAIDSSVAAREQRWSYNEYGQVLKYDGPLAGSADTTTYEYYDTTNLTGSDPLVSGVTRGDLKKVTPPGAGYTLYKRYNKLGQVLEVEDANGVVTSYTYDVRQHLTRQTVGAESTLYDYWPTGLLKKVTQPDGSWTFYEHDDAHRLYNVSDSAGNSVTYTLDNMGNRVDEQIKDPGGLMRRKLGRSIDALGRVQQVTGRE